MAVPRVGTFQPGAVRDALGLVRVLWAVERDGEADVARLKSLSQIGAKLRETLDLGRLREETLGYRAAVLRSWEAVDALASLTWPAEVAELVRKTQTRVRAGAMPGYALARDDRKQGEAARR